MRPRFPLRRRRTPADPPGSLSRAHGRLYSISTITGIVAWAIILITYLRFFYGLKRQGLSRDDLPYKAPWQPYASWVALVFIILVCIFNGFSVFVGDSWDVSDFIAAYVGVAGVFVFWGGWKCFGGKRTSRRQIFAFTKCDPVSSLTSLPSPRPPLLVVLSQPPPPTPTSFALLRRLSLVVVPSPHTHTPHLPSSPLSPIVEALKNGAPPRSLPS